MAEITLTIPTAHESRVVHALCVSAGLTDETAANAKAAIIRHIKATVHNVERSEAERVALAAVPDPDTDGITT